MRDFFRRVYAKIHGQRCVLQLLIIAAALAADQVSKSVVMPILNALPEKTIPVIQGVFSLTYVENEGASFGMLQGKRVFFLIATAITLAALITYMIRARKKQGLWLRVCLPLITAGAAGNFIDRIFNGGRVRDFLDFSAMQLPFGWHFKFIFNVADMCLVAGSIMLGIFLLFMYKEKDGKPLLARRGRKDGSLEDGAETGAEGDGARSGGETAKEEPEDDAKPKQRSRRKAARGEGGEEED